MTTVQETTMTAGLGDIEQWLDDHDVDWTLEVVDLDDIDLRSGLNNQTRLDALNADAVARYTADMEAGATFPPVILRRHEGRWVPVDGNHRLASARAAGRTSHAAYCAPKLTAEHAHQLSIAANRTHGLPLTDEERLWHAVQMTKDGATVEHASATCGLPATRLRAKLVADRFATRAAQMQLAGWGDLSTTNRMVLMGIADDRLFRRVVELVAERAVLAAEVPPLVAHVNSLDLNEAFEHCAQLKADARGRYRRETGRPPSAAASPRKRLLGDLDILIARFQARAVAEDCTTNEARQQVSDQIKAAVRHLINIEKGLWR